MSRKVERALWTWKTCRHSLKWPMPAAYRQPRAGSVCQNPSSAVGWSGLKKSLVSSFSRGRHAVPRSPKRARHSVTMLRGSAPKSILRERRSCLPAICAADCGSLRPYLSVPRHLAPVLAQLAARHPRLQVHTSYTDRFVDLVGEGFDCAIRVGYLSDFEPDRTADRAYPWNARR